ncbi:hypothetical protein QBC39DRAFT_340765 [Podospora conica]|nr:hypothetical protein QBC39DRAFT_340765 [Schizothecium conicum]
MDTSTPPDKNNTMENQNWSEKQNPPDAHLAPPVPLPDKDGSETTGTGTDAASIHDPASSAPPLPPTSAGDPSPNEVLPGLPRLDYNLWNYKWKLSFIVFLLVVESSLLPIALYYGLYFNTTLRLGLVFAIITSFFGIVTGIEFGLRMLKLILKGDTYRPRGGTKWSFDFTHHTLSVGYTYMSGILIGASIPHNPPVRPLAIPVSLFLVQMGVQLLWSGWMVANGKKAPCRVSNVAKGEPMPPFVLTAVEDIVAVDGGAGREYRDQLHARYKASAMFRRMIMRQTWFWGWGSLLVGVGTLVVVWTVPVSVAYGVGWGAPLIFTIVWITTCVLWVRRDLRMEKKRWLGVHMAEIPAEALRH